MIHRILNRKKRTAVSKQNPKTEFSLGFSASQSMEYAIDQILKEASELPFSESNFEESPLDPQPIPQDCGFETPNLPLPASIFAKKTISKNKTFRGLNNPLKVPHTLQNKQAPPAVPKSPPFSIQKSTQPPSPISLPSATAPSFPLPHVPPSSSTHAVRISIGKELLKAAAACQMISIQEAHSMGSKISLPSSGLLIPPLAELLHRNPETVQKNLLSKIAKINIPFDYFKSLIGNQSVQKYHSLLIPYKIIPLFYRGNSLTVLAEHPFLISLTETILKENQTPVAWIHFIPATLEDLESLS